jgi:hypothetical protein
MSYAEERYALRTAGETPGLQLLRIKWATGNWKLSYESKSIRKENL